MPSKPIIAIIVLAAFFVAFGVMVLHAELITDEKRFLIQKINDINQTAIGEAFEYPSNPANIEIHFIELLPGASSGWHTHDVPLIVTVLHGEVTIYYCNENPDCSNVKSFKSGDSFVEAINVRHNGINEGVIPAKLHVTTLNPEDNWTAKYTAEN